MINHISLGVHNPEKVAVVLAELWSGYALPFPVCAASFIVFADDERGTVLEITPNNVAALDDFYRHFPAKLTVGPDRFVNRAHAAASDFAGDLIIAQTQAQHRVFVFVNPH